MPTTYVNMPPAPGPPPPLVIENLQNHLLFKFFTFRFAF